MNALFSFKKISLAVFSLMIFSIGNTSKAQIMTLPCIDAGVAASGATAGGNQVCGCDGNIYADGTAALAAGVTHFTDDSCGVTPTCHADFYYGYTGLDYVFLDSSAVTAGTYYSWDFGDGSNSYIINPAHTYTVPGYYVVGLWIYDSLASCFSQSWRVVNADTTVVSSSFFYTYVTTANANCNPNGSATANTYGGTAPFTYLWSNGSTDQTATGLSAGNYSVTVTDNVGLTATGSHSLFADCYNVIQGTAFNDLNGNCVMDLGENPMQSVFIQADNGTSSYYGSADANGNYSIEIPIAGTFTLSANLYGYGSCGNLVACASSTVTFPTVGDTSSGNNIGFQGSTGFDLTNHPGWTGANPGFDKEYWMLPYNASFTPFTGTATVVFHYDGNLVYLNSMNPQPVHDAVNHTLTWMCSNLPSPSWDWTNYRLRCFFHVPSSLSVSYLLQSTFTISPTSGDCSTTNNYQHYSESVTGSHDPNAKEVLPEGNITEADTMLTYTIHFQNNGNDTTHFVVLTDTLSPYVDPASVVNLASSHEYSEFSLSGEGILKWVFNPCFLPDSATNEAESKGFVQFSVNLDPGLPVGTVINNSASIVFDYNTPIITNTASNTVITGIGEIESASSVNIFPNPATDELTIEISGTSVAKNISITDVLGREIFNDNQILNTKSYNLTALANGIYFVKVQMENGDAVIKKLVKE